MPAKRTEHTDEQTPAENTERTFSPRGEIFFFPNTGEGEHRSYEAVSREEAEELNQKYLDDSNATKEETN